MTSHEDVLKRMGSNSVRYTYNGKEYFKDFKDWGNLDKFLIEADIQPIEIIRLGEKIINIEDFIQCKKEWHNSVRSYSFKEVTEYRDDNVRIAKVQEAWL